MKILEPVLSFWSGIWYLIRVLISLGSYITGPATQEMPDLARDALVMVNRTLQGYDRVREQLDL